MNTFDLLCCALIRIYIGARLLEKMSSEELFCSDYPIYSLGLLGDGGAEFYVTGGGGKSKTGIPNSLVRPSFTKVYPVLTFCASLYLDICIASVSMLLKLYNTNFGANDYV